MGWNRILSDAGLSDKEANAIIALSNRPNIKASELAKDLGTTRLDAYNSLERLQRIGLVTSTADRPMRFSSPPIGEVVKMLIDIRREQLSRIEENYKGLNTDLSASDTIDENSPEDAKFAVLKERIHILKRIEKMAEEAEESLMLVLGRFGILHLCRSPSLEAINTAAAKGISIRVLAQLDRRTIRFYEQLEDLIEVRHSDDIESQGVVMDVSETIQYLNAEENPVGRGRTDAALVVESTTFADSQLNLMEAIWDDAIPFETASKRFTEQKIVEPLKLTLDSMSFLDRMRDVLQIKDELPDTDTPFDPSAFMASGLEVNEARRNLESGGISSLSSFGIDISSLLRQVGNRIGEELAFSLRNIEGNIEFLNEMMDWWEYAGLGNLSYDIEPEFHIKVILGSPVSEDNGLPLWALDDGIIEGALLARYSPGGEVMVQREENQDDEEFCRYNLIMSSKPEDI
ncbi:MAG: hypothetical protein CMA76_03045 [Euryarchaeota archaeon]|nr:hypothetical protein [Euryarchaeota archaeon]